MKIVYKNKKTKEYIYSWLNSCIDQFYGNKITDNIMISPNSFLVNKDKLLQRIIAETNCFNDEISIQLDIIKETLFENNQIVNYLTSEGEQGKFDFHKASFDTPSIICVTQGEEMRVFRYNYVGNPSNCKENLLKEYDIPEQSAKMSK